MQHSSVNNISRIISHSPTKCKRFFKKWQHVYEKTPLKKRTAAIFKNDRWPMVRKKRSALYRQLRSRATWYKNTRQGFIFLSQPQWRILISVFFDFLPPLFNGCRYFSYQLCHLGSRYWMAFRCEQTGCSGSAQCASAYGSA